MFSNRITSSILSQIAKSGIVPASQCGTPDDHRKSSAKEGEETCEVMDLTLDEAYPDGHSEVSEEWIDDFWPTNAHNQSIDVAGMMVDQSTQTEALMEEPAKHEVGTETRQDASTSAHRYVPSAASSQNQGAALKSLTMQCHELQEGNRKLISRLAMVENQNAMLAEALRDHRASLASEKGMVARLIHQREWESAIWRSSPKSLRPGIGSWRGSYRRSRSRVTSSS